MLYDTIDLSFTRVNKYFKQGRRVDSFNKGVFYMYIFQVFICMFSFFNFVIYLNLLNR